MSDARLTLDKLRAVQRALDPSRLADEADIIISTIAVGLTDSPPMTELELCRYVAELWPGTKIQPERIAQAARAGVAAGVFLEQPTLDGEAGYSLAPDTGLSSGVTSQAAAVLEETRTAVVTRFNAEYQRELMPSEADVLVSALVEALGAGIRQAFTTFSGRVKKLGSTSLVPDEWNRAAIDEVLNAYGFDEATRAVMDALVLSALEPSSRFGSDIVTQLATGYILYGFLARRDQAEALRKTGPLSGITLLLDTPHLLSLSGNGPVSRSLLTTLQAANSAHLDVIAPQHVVEELISLLDTVGAGEKVGAVGRALADGDDPYVIATTIDDDVIAAWLSHAVEGEPLTWDQYRQRLNTLPKLMPGVGLTVRALADVEEARTLSIQLRDLVTDVDRERSAASGMRPRRRRDALRADGQTLAMAAQQREKSTRPVWPGAWVVTPDRVMDDAYGRYDPDDDFPITITPAQLAGLVATFVNPAGEHALAQSAARMVSHDTVLEVAGRYPVEVAVKLARSMRDQGASEVDVRLAQQTTIEDLLYGAASLGDVGDDVAAAVAQKRAARREALAGQDRDRALRDKRDAEEARKKAVREAEAQEQRAREAARLQEEAHAAAARELEDQVTAEAEARSQLEEQLRQERAERQAEDLERQREQEERAAVEHARHRTKVRRSQLAAVSVALVAVGVTLLVRTSLTSWPYGFMLSGATLFALGWTEAEREEWHWSRMWFAFIPHLTGIYDAVK